MKIKTLVNNIDKFNKMLADAIAEMDGHNEFFEVGTTIIGDFSTIAPITYNVDGENIQISFDGEEYTLSYDNELKMCYCRANEFYDEDYLMDGIREYKKRIKKSLKVWRSENPDEELENDNEEDEE